MSTITLSKPRSSISHTTGRSASTGTHDLWMRKASTHKDINHFKNIQPVAIMHSGSLLFFIPLADRSYAGARAGASQRDLYCEIAHIFAPRQSHSEALLLQPCGTFASCDGRKGPQSFNQRSGKLFSVDVVVVVVQRMPSSLCQGPDNHLIQAYVCVMDLSWHTRRNVVGNKVIN